MGTSSTLTVKKLYWADSGNNRISVVHVWGTPYEMGFAQGRILKDRLTGFMTSLWDYMIDEITHEINEFLPDLPDWFVEDVAQVYYTPNLVEKNNGHGRVVSNGLLTKQPTSPLNSLPSTSIRSSKACPTRPELTSKWCNKFICLVN